MSHHEAIRDLLTGKLYEDHKFHWNSEKRSVAEVCFEIGKTLSFSKNDVYQYVKKYGLPDGLLRTKESSTDGSYLVKQDDGKYASYGQERGARHGLKIFNTYEQAVRGIVDAIISPFFGE